MATHESTTGKCMVPCHITMKDIETLQPSMLTRIGTWNHTSKGLHLDDSACCTTASGPPMYTEEDVKLTVYREDSRRGTFYPMFKGPVTSDWKQIRQGSFTDLCTANTVCNLLTSMPVELQKISQMGRRVLETLMPCAIKREHAGMEISLKKFDEPLGWSLYVREPRYSNTDDGWEKLDVRWGSSLIPKEVTGRILENRLQPYLGGTIIIKTSTDTVTLLNPYLYTARTQNVCDVVAKIYRQTTGKELPQGCLAPPASTSDGATTVNGPFDSPPVRHLDPLPSLDDVSAAVPAAPVVATTATAEVDASTMDSAECSDGLPGSGASADDHGGDGGCTAAALVALGVCPSKRAAIIMLDAQIAPLHETFVSERGACDESIAGIRGDRWHDFAIHKAVMASGFHLRELPIDSPHEQRVDLGEELKKGSYLVLGVTNNYWVKLLRNGEEEEQILKYADYSADAPFHSVAEWHHSIAIVDGKIRDFKKSFPIGSLWLQENNQPDPHKGYMHSLRRVYRVLPGAPEMDANETDEPTVTTTMTPQSTLGYRSANPIPSQSHGMKRTHEVIDLVNDEEEESEGVSPKRRAAAPSSLSPPSNTWMMDVVTTAASYLNLCPAERVVKKLPNVPRKVIDDVLRAEREADEKHTRVAASFQELSEANRRLYEAVSG